MKEDELCSLVFSKKAKSEDVLQCLLGLNETDIKVLKRLSKPQTANYLVKSLKINQSTASRSLCKLEARNLILKKKRSVGKGYYYEFTAVPKGKLKKHLVSELKVKTKEIEKLIKKL